MASSGPNGTGAGANDASAGTLAWSNPGNITVSDAVYAVAQTAGTQPLTSQILKATNFGFSIPAGAQILGVVDEIQRRATSLGVVKDASIKLIISGTIAGTDRANTGVGWPTTEAFATYGSSSDTAGLTITPAQINDATSGVAIQVTISQVSVGAAVDYVRRTVYYALPRTISSTTGFKATPARTVHATTGFTSTLSRLLHGTTGLKATLTRRVTSTTLFRSLRTITSTTLFSGSPHRRVASSTLFAYDLSSPLLAPTVTDGATSASGMDASAAALASDDANNASLSGPLHAVMIGSGGTKARFS